MKVLMINGSRREKGCTYTALSIIAKVLEKNGIESEILHIGERAVKGEIDDLVKEAGDRMKSADGLVLGSPVYYASPSGEIISFLDRFFWKYGKELRCKPGAAVVSARRGGTTASLDVLNKYIVYSEMPLVGSRYWNMVHGSKPEEVLKDEEGVQIMQVLGNNLAWILKCIEAGKAQGVEMPEEVAKIFTNFIR